MSDKIPQMKINDGFNFALYLTPPNQFLESNTQERERIQMELNLDTPSYNDFDRMSKNSTIKNLLSRDLVKNLENISPSKSYLSLGNQLNNLSLNENENEKRNNDFSELISPINISNNKHYKIDNNEFQQKAEKSIIQLISPVNNDNQHFDLTKNNFLPKMNDQRNIDKSQIKIDYYANNLDVNNGNSFQNGAERLNQINNPFDEYNYFNQNGHISPNNTENYFNSLLPKTTQDNTNQYFFPGQINSFPNYQQFPNNIYKDQKYILNQPQKRVNMNNNPGNDKKKKQFTERLGDWVCMKCRNLNFSFRVICNRCQLPKSESEIRYLEHMNNLSNLNKRNDMLQNQIFCENLMNKNNYNSLNSSMFSLNTVYNQSAMYGKI